MGARVVGFGVISVAVGAGAVGVRLVAVGASDVGGLFVAVGCRFVGRPVGGNVALCVGVGCEFVGSAGVKPGVGKTVAANPVSITSGTSRGVGMNKPTASGVLPKARSGLRKPLSRHKSSKIPGKMGASNGDSSKE